MGQDEAPPAPADNAWGKLLDRWHDEGRIFHLLDAYGAPRCGTSYFTSTGATHGPFPLANCCKRCVAIARKR
jgi:hypothetical protein